LSACGALKGKSGHTHPSQTSEGSGDAKQDAAASSTDTSTGTSSATTQSDDKGSGDANKNAKKDGASTDKATSTDTESSTDATTDTATSTDTDPAGGTDTTDDPGPWTGIKMFGRKDRYVSVHGTTVDSNGRVIVIGYHSTRDPSVGGTIQDAESFVAAYDASG